jgi:hypothetical protein
MALGTLGAIALGASAIGGIANAAQSGSASRRAVDASTQATQENNALAREIYGQNRQTLAPFVNQGTAATSYINQLLGIAQPQQQQPQMGGMGGGFNADAYLQQNPDVAQEFGRQNQYQTPQSYAQFHYDTYGKNEGRQAPMMGGSLTPTAPAGDAMQGFDAFRNSTGYNFRVNEGQRAITNNAAVRGMLNSGATLKGLTRFGQDIGSQEFGNYLNTLLGQQSLGANAASAQAGQATNFSSQVQANNAANASNVGNAALARAGNNTQFLNSLLGAGAYALGGRG